MMTSLEGSILDLGYLVRKQTMTQVPIIINLGVLRSQLRPVLQAAISRKLPAGYSSGA
jgi:hypothetical protein